MAALLTGGCVARCRWRIGGRRGEGKGVGCGGEEVSEFGACSSCLSLCVGRGTPYKFLDLES